MREITDRREAYYVKLAPLIAKFPLWFYWRAEAGRQIQSRIKVKDLVPFIAPKSFKDAEVIDFRAKAERMRRCAE